jgi:hypothetical protein
MGLLKKSDANQADMSKALQAAKIPYMYIPYKEPNNHAVKPVPDSQIFPKSRALEGTPPKYTTSSDSAISLELDSLILPGPPTSFAYTERVAIKSELYRKITALINDLQAFVKAEAGNWAKWLKCQEFLVETQVLMANNDTPDFHFYIKHKWALLRFHHSKRKRLAQRLHVSNIEIKACAVLDEIMMQFEEAGTDLQVLDEIEKEIMKSRKKRTWLEKWKDPHRKREDELLDALYLQEAEALRTAYPGAEQLYISQR